MKKSIFALCLLLMTMAAATASACDHGYGSWWVKRAPTCTAPGLKFKNCLHCDHWEQAPIPKLPHAVAEWTITKEPTCVLEGGKEGFCSTCNSVVRFRIEKIEHVWGDVVETKAPTCTSHGKGERICSGCGRKKTVTIEKLGHDLGETTVTKEPTCKAKGKGTRTCARCGRTTEVTIANLEHVYDEGVVKQEPQGLKKGVREKTCTLCGEKRTERFYHEGTLYQDMQPCPEVIHLQEMLRDLSYYGGSISSGKFGEQTARAVERFQKASGMQGTGLADPATLEAIEKAWEQKTGKSAAEAVVQEETGSARAIAQFELYQDMKACPEVIRLQEMLRDLGYYGGSIRSGIFGEQTAKAVMRFQRAEGMRQTGIADHETQTAIVAAWEKKTGKTFGEELPAEAANAAVEAAAAQ